jgi:hypothetical protein
MQTNLLRQFAPHALHLLYHPVDTGNPGHDMTEHISNNLGHRIDIEGTQLVGDRVIGRVEPDLASMTEADQASKILTVLYAEKQFGNNTDAVEFVRVVKQAVGAGVETDPRSLQIWASWGYDEIKVRFSAFSRNNPSLFERAATSKSDAELVEEFKAKIVQEVLTEIAMMAMELTAVTATSEDRLMDEPEVVELSIAPEYLMSADERRELSQLRYEEVMGTHEPKDAFAAELRAICSKLARSHASGTGYDEEAQFQSYLADEAGRGSSEEDLEAVQDSHERVTEQYSEGGVVSLHMSDGEKFVVDGTLDEDVDESYLPFHARHIAGEVAQLFREGEDMETIDKFIEFRLNDVYGDPADKGSRVIRTMRSLITIKQPTRRRADGTCSPKAAVGTSTQPFEVKYTVSAYPNREERAYVREVLDKIIENMQRDFNLRSMNRSAEYRSFVEQIAEATETRSLVAAIQRAYQSRLQGSISVKMFTALNTAYAVKRAALENTPAKAVRVVDGRERTFILAVPFLSVASVIKGRDLRGLATEIHTLPAQERERVRRFLQAERPELYSRIMEGLLQIVETASQRKRMYLRFAFFEDRKTGRPNEAHNMIHLLTAADKATVWENLKALSGVAEPVAA